MPTLTQKQVARALDHLRSDYPDDMSVTEEDDYVDVLTHLRPGELLGATEKLPLDRRPSAEEILRTVMEARPAPYPGPYTRGGKAEKADPKVVYGVLEQARRDLARVRDAV